MDTGSKSSRITPADGLAFFTSAISLIGPGAASGVKKLRTGGAAANCVRSAASGTAVLRLSISARFVATILSRIVGIFAIERSEGMTKSPSQLRTDANDHLNDVAEKRYR